jgi:hypothetical protein
MKRRINLLSITITKRKLSEVAGDFRLKAIIFLIILTIVGVVELFIHFYLQNEIKKYEISKVTLEQYVDSNKEFEDKIKYFFYKYGLLKKYLKDDANGYAYYEKVQAIVSEASPNAKITGFNYKNNGETNFSVTFASYDEAEGFIAALETPLFLDLFQYISLQGFDAADQISRTDFTISVIAQFIQQDEN